MFTPVNLQIYHYGANNPLKYVDPTGRFIINNYGSQRVKNAANVLRAESPTFKKVFDLYARSSEYHVQFSDVSLSSRGVLGEMKASIFPPTSEDMPALTLDGDDPVENAIPAGENALVALINIDVDAIISQANELDIDPDVALMHVVAHEVGHALDLLEMGYDGFWADQAAEASVPYSDRPSEQRAEAFKAQVMDEVLNN